MEQVKGKKEDVNNLARKNLTRSTLDRAGPLVARRFADGGEAQRELNEFDARQEYLRKNPQYATPEPGLEPVYPEVIAMGQVAALRAEKRLADAAQKLEKELYRRARKQAGDEPELPNELTQRTRRSNPFDKYKKKKPDQSYADTLDTIGALLRLSPGTLQALGIMPDTKPPEKR
jgi:uncharacterized protein (UPF0332 family)